MAESEKSKERTESISGLAQELESIGDVVLSGSGPRLIIIYGGKTNSKYELSTDKTTVGRHPTSDIFLDDVTVSRQHAVILKTPDGFQIQDMGSLNGTYINKERTETKVLSSRDELQIGKFKFIYLDEEVKE